MNRDIPEVGLFFYIGGKVYGWGQPADATEAHCGWKNLEDEDPEFNTHLEYFDVLVDTFPELKLSLKDDYSWYPRGRVIYNVSEDTFYVYIDKCLDTEAVKKAITTEFSLSGANVKWLYDGHYICANCDTELRHQMIEQKGR